MKIFIHYRKRNLDFIIWLSMVCVQYSGWKNPFLYQNNLVFMEKWLKQMTSRIQWTSKGIYKFYWSVTTIYSLSPWKAGKQYLCSLTSHLVHIRLVVFPQGTHLDFFSSNPMRWLISSNLMHSSTLFATLLLWKTVSVDGMIFLLCLYVYK